MSQITLELPDDVEQKFYAFARERGLRPEAALAYFLEQEKNQQKGIGPMALPPPYLPPPFQTGDKVTPNSISKMGVVSLVIGILGIFAWLGFFIIVAIVENSKNISENFQIGVGFSYIIGSVINIVAIILGIIGIKKSNQKLIPISGTILNSCQFIIGLILFIIGTIAQDSN
jgi:hypothetical protein